MATELECLSGLEKRVAVLEQRLIGEEKVREGQPSLIHLVNTINGKLKALGFSPDVKEVWKRRDELEKFLQPDFMNSIKLDEKAKEELLLCFAEQLAKIQEQAEEIEGLKDFVNSPSFRGLEKESKDISSLAQAHVAQDEKVKFLTKQVQSFLESYTKLLLKLSQQCVDWDDTVSKLSRQ